MVRFVWDVPDTRLEFSKIVHANKFSEEIFAVLQTAFGKFPLSFQL